MPSRRRLSAPAAVLGGALVVGTLDILDALVFFGLRGAQPIRIFQSIAVGLIGRSAYQGGLRTAVLGGCLHFCIALGIVTTFYVISRVVPTLLTRPVITAVFYGLGVYFTMNYVVVPLSAAGNGWAWPSWPVLANGLLIHIFGVGLPSVFFVRAAAPASGRA